MKGKFIALMGHGGDDLDSTPCLLLEMTDELHKSILSRAEDVAKLTEKYGTSLYALSFFDYSGEWFDLYALDEEREDVDAFQLAIYDQGSVVLEKDDPLLKHILERCENSEYEGGAHIRTECNEMIVVNDRVLFSMILKHTDIRLESTSIEYKDLK